MVKQKAVVELPADVSKDDAILAGKRSNSRQAYRKRCKRNLCSGTNH